MLFSQRCGFTPIRDIIQIHTMDEKLRNSLWNVLTLFYWDHMQGYRWVSDYAPMQKLFKSLWIHYFKKPLDTLDDNWINALAQVRKYFFACQWYEAHDFIEFVTNNYPYTSVNESFQDACNLSLERELSGYRFVGKHITPITSPEEITSIENAMDASPPVSQHLKTAVSFLADKQSPDYRNSIKESISAVESICCRIAEDPKATLGHALKKLDTKVETHTALREAFSKIYGYTSDADGIRHALLEESNLDFEDAKFMLVSCSAFVNYLLAKSAKAGINLK